MPGNTKPSQRKGKRRKQDHQEPDEPLHKRSKNDAFDSNRTVPPGVPSAANPQSSTIDAPQFHNAVEHNVGRPLERPTLFAPSVPPGQVLQTQRMFVPSRFRHPGLPIMNLQSHQIPGLQNIRPGLRPQIIPSQIRTPTGIYYGHIVVQPGASIRQPIPVVMSPNFNPRPRIPMANVRPHNPRGPAPVVFNHPGLNVPPNLQQLSYRAPTPTIDATQPQERPTASKHAERYYRCTECLERFPTITKLDNHQRIHQGKPQERRILCADPKCKSLFKDFLELDKHFKECHLQLDLECDVCGQKFINSCDLNNHKERHN
ncbi:uncharacterized protein LOC135717181 [Ochlerotatus camptorhynchus]|uniref:uncharacterized protein LOC135717181 n=1 Tax=Ochlerotatus camptorhynchus TaxID=644619 RepID=UPI0031DC3FDE